MQVGPGQKLTAFNLEQRVLYSFCTPMNSWVMSVIFRGFCAFRSLEIFMASTLTSWTFSARLSDTNVNAGMTRTVPSYHREWDEEASKAWLVCLPRTRLVTQPYPALSRKESCSLQSSLHSCCKLLQVAASCLEAFPVQRRLCWSRLLVHWGHHPDLCHEDEESQCCFHEQRESRNAGGQYDLRLCRRNRSQVRLGSLQPLLWVLPKSSFASLDQQRSLGGACGHPRSPASCVVARSDAWSRGCRPGERPSHDLGRDCLGGSIHRTHTQQLQGGCGQCSTNRRKVGDGFSNDHRLPVVRSQRWSWIWSILPKEPRCFHVWPRCHGAVLPGEQHQSGDPIAWGESWGLAEGPRHADERLQRSQLPGHRRQQGRLPATRARARWKAPGQARSMSICDVSKMYNHSVGNRGPQSVFRTDTPIHRLPSIQGLGLI